MFQNISSLETFTFLKEKPEKNEHHLEIYWSDILFVKEANYSDYLSEEQIIELLL